MSPTRSRYATAALAVLLVAIGFLLGAAVIRFATPETPDDEVPAYPSKSTFR